MRTRSGLIELGSGWIVAVAAVAKGQVRMLIEFDPKQVGPNGHGVKELRLTVDEAGEVQQAFADACHRASGR